jgi:hypothetical protein
MEATMFGLFKKYDDVYDELYDHLVNDWQMKDRYAKAFLDVYRKTLAKIHGEGKERMHQLRNSDNPEHRLLSVVAGGDQNNYALVAQAYMGYMADLRRGKHIDTDVELAIWAILSNRSDLLETLDRAFARYIEEKTEEKFPKLFDTVFSIAAEDG